MGPRRRSLRYLLAKGMMPPKPSVLLLETVEVGELHSGVRLYV